MLAKLNPMKWKKYFKSESFEYSRFCSGKFRNLFLKNDVDELANALDEITKGNYKDGYYLDVERGEYLRKDFNENFSNYFKLI